MRTPSHSEKAGFRNISERELTLEQLEAVSAGSIGSTLSDIASAFKKLADHYSKTYTDPVVKIIAANLKV